MVARAIFVRILIMIRNHMHVSDVGQCIGIWFRYLHYRVLILINDKFFCPLWKLFAPPLYS